MTSFVLMLKPLDVIELRVPVGDWVAGTTGTVHEVGPDSLLVEVSNDDGVTLDLLTVPADAAKLVWPIQAAEPDGVPGNGSTAGAVPDRSRR